MLRGLWFGDAFGECVSFGSFLFTFVFFSLFVVVLSCGVPKTCVRYSFNMFILFFTLKGFFWEFWEFILESPYRVSREKFSKKTPFTPKTPTFT